MTNRTLDLVTQINEKCVTLGNDGEILSTENHVTLTMQLGHVNYMQCGTHSEVFAG